MFWKHPTKVQKRTLSKKNTFIFYIWACGKKLLGCIVWSQELDLMIPMGPFQLRRLYDSKIGHLRYDGLKLLL